MNNSQSRKVVDFGKYPWPTSEPHVTPPGYSTPEKWWDQLHWSHRERWAPVLRALTPAQRERFFVERRKLIDTLPPVHEAFCRQACDEVEDQLHARWKAISEVAGEGA